jgi:hypothetical protein
MREIFTNNNKIRGVERGHCQANIKVEVFKRIA